MSEHAIELHRRGFDDVREAFGCRTVCVPCGWVGPWRTSQGTAQHDGSVHCKFEDRHNGSACPRQDRLS